MRFLQNPRVVVGLVLVLYALAAVTYSIATQANWNHRLRCLETYANDLTVRGTVLSKAEKTFTAAQDARTLALDKVLLEAIHKDQAGVKRDLPAYVKAAQDYQAASANLKTVFAKYPQPTISQVKC